MDGQIEAFVFVWRLETGGNPVGGAFGLGRKRGTGIEKIGGPVGDKDSSLSYRISVNQYQDNGGQNELVFENTFQTSKP